MYLKTNLIEEQISKKGKHSRPSRLDYVTNAASLDTEASVNAHVI